MTLKSLTVESSSPRPKSPAAAYSYLFSHFFLIDRKMFGILKHKPRKMIFEAVKPSSLAKTAACVPEISLPRLLQES